MCIRRTDSHQIDVKDSAVCKIAMDIFGEPFGHQLIEWRVNVSQSLSFGYIRNWSQP